MQITDLLNQTGGTSAIARELGLPESQAASGAAALLPSILAGLQKPGATGQAGGLGGLLGSLGGGALLEKVLSPQATDVAPGNDLLGHLFGNKDGSRAVAQEAAQTSGLDPSILKKMLPLVTMVVAGYLAKQGGGGTGGPGGVLGNLGGALGGGNPGGGNAINDLLGRLGR